VSSAALKIRTIRGEIVHVPNSQVVTLRVIPRGYREVEVEFFASEPQKGRELVEGVAPIVPVGRRGSSGARRSSRPSRSRPDLYRITARCAVAAGREWLAEDFLPTLMKETPRRDLLAHGPVVTFVDERGRANLRAGRGEALAVARPAAHRRRALRPRIVDRATQHLAMGRSCVAWGQRAGTSTRRVGQS
jgi:hypothetical protein